MAHINGIVKKIHDNRLDQNRQPSKYPNFKIIVDDIEATLWSAITPVCKEGDKVSLHYGTSKKTGKYFVLTDENKNPKIQVYPQGTDLDDDLPQSEKEWLAAPAEKPTDFNPVSYEKEMVSDKKGMVIFVQGLIQADIRAGNIKLNEVTESTMAHVIDLYKKLTK